MQPLVATLAAFASAALEPAPVRAVDESSLREYTGVYQWDRDAFVYLQLWDEFSGSGLKPARPPAATSGEVILPVASRWNSLSDSTDVLTAAAGPAG